MKKYTYKKIGSTNEKIRGILEGNPELPFAVTAFELSRGVGRKGKKYFCPKGGVWLTYVDKYSKDVGNRYSLLAALAVSKTLGEYDIETSIKWPNDVYLEGKKLAGILTLIKKGYVFVGFGVNTNVESFPSDLKGSSISTLIARGVAINNEKFIDKFLNVFKGFLLSPTEHIEAICKRMLWIGRKVTLISAGKKYLGAFKGITNDGYAEVGNKILVDGSMRLAG